VTPLQAAGGQQLGSNEWNMNACYPADVWMLCMPQEEALKPFVAVLRLADSPAVRQRAVQAVAAALTAHPRGLGSGAGAPGSGFQGSLYSTRLTPWRCRSVHRQAWL
jgi:hypothetical protein